MNIDFELAKRFGGTHESCFDDDKIYRYVGQRVEVLEPHAWVTCEISAYDLVKIKFPEDNRDEPTHGALDGREGVEWDGEGLPPVGVECEFYSDGLHDSNKYEWCIFHGLMTNGDLIVEHKFKKDSVIFCCQPFDPKLTKFRPLETPEQKAARETIEAASNYLHEKGFSHDQLMLKALYSQGFLKLDNK